MEIKSSKPKKQRKQLYKMALHKRNKTVSARLGEKLRKEIGKKTLPVRKEDTVKIMRGSKKGKTGKIARVDYVKRRVFIEGVIRKKADGTEILMPFSTSNLMINEITRDDERRIKGKKIGKKSTKEKEKESKTEKKKEKVK